MRGGGNGMLIGGGIEVLWEGRKLRALVRGYRRWVSFGVRILGLGFGLHIALALGLLPSREVLE